MQDVAESIPDQPGPDVQRPSPRKKPMGRKKAASLSRQIVVRPKSVVAILDTVGAHFGLSWEELIGPRRTAYLANARHVAAWLMRQSGLSLEEIGRALGGRDHTTMLHSIRQIEELRAVDPDVCRALDGMVAG